MTLANLNARGTSVIQRVNRSYGNVSTTLEDDIFRKTHQSRLGLVVRHHMARLEDLHKRDVARRDAVAARAAHGARVAARVEREPRRGRARFELVVEHVLELLDPRLVALPHASATHTAGRERGRGTHHEVAHHVRVAGVHEQADAVRE